MSWAPNDLVTDADLVAYETSILTQFKRVDWQDRRQKALEDWLYPLLVARGYAPHRLRTRYQPDQVWSYTASVYTDRTAAASDQAVNDVPLASAFATPASDYLYVGSVVPFRGLSVRLTDQVSATSSVLAVAQWDDAWKTLAATDGTQAVSGRVFSGGGSITWKFLPGWVTRTINGSDHLYWIRLGVSATLTASTAAAQMSCIRRSLLCAPVTLRTLELIFREAPTSQEGQWQAKAEFYAVEAEKAFERAADHIGGEFDTITEDDAIDADEATQTAAEARATEFTWERG